MRRIDKKLNMMKANLLAESRYLESKGLLTEVISGPQKTDLDIKRLADDIVKRTQHLIPDMNAVYDAQKELINDTAKENKETRDRLVDIVGVLTSTIKSRLIGLSEEDDANLDENRFSHWERQYEELLKNDRISSFINQFEKYRKNALANVDLEIRPVFADIQVRFVDKSVPSTAGKDKFRDIHVDADSSNYESGQIMFKYNDTTCIFKGNQQGDSIDYTYDKTINTDYNNPRTKEGLQVAKTFEDICKSFRFRLNKNEVPTSFYKK
jgi:hypothetical protein